MAASVFELLSMLGALISCSAAVFAVFTVRRGADADLKGDVIELSRLVERISKDARRDKMRRVRMGEKVGDPTDSMEIPPGAEEIPLQTALAGGKDALRRRVLATRGIGR